MTVSGRRGVSHIGIGVADLERSTAFYRDVLGCRVLDRYGYYVPADPSMGGLGNARQDDRWWREVAVLRVGDADDGPVIVMALHDLGHPAHRVEMDDIGTHHWAMWVSGIEDYVERLDRAGVEWCVPLRTYESGRAWGFPEGVNVKSCIFRDPDGTLVQLDEVAT